MLDYMRELDKKRMRVLEHVRIRINGESLDIAIPWGGGMFSKQIDNAGKLCVI